MDETVEAIPMDEKEWMVRRIADIKDKGCYLKLLDLIHTDGLKYTVNQNGIFFNIGTMPDATFVKVSAIVETYENKKRRREPQR